MKQEILEKAQNWATNEYFDEKTRAEISKLIEENNEQLLTEYFYKDLEFGTGGIRSILGPGTNRINVYNIKKATQALASSITSSFPGEKLKVAISYDNRRFSFEFAKTAATVLAGNNIHSYIYKRLNPVPLLSFSVRHHQAHAGIMITASHNPPEYNGFKVFWNDGAQVTPPNDKNVIAEYNKIKSYESVKEMDFNEAEKEELVTWVDTDVEDEYFKNIKTKVVNQTMCKEHGDKLGIVYTPIHGTGLVPCERILRDLGFNSLKIVQEQAQPDEDFPTVKSPNPENPDALAMAVDLMEKEKFDLALGTDPDTDRVGIALKNAQGKTDYLNGNQIGILMLHYILDSLNKQERLPENSYFVKTIVTTPLQEEIAKAFGVEGFNTLTGFKWICGKMIELEQTSPEKNFLFATEESFGYLNHPYVRDKDGVSSIALLCEVALHHKLQGKTLFDALDDIYNEYGFSSEQLLCLDYHGKVGAEKIERIMSCFRNEFNRNLFDFDVESKYDYQSSVITNFSNDTHSKIELPKSNVLGFHLKHGQRVYLRPSGTEPKIKFYLMFNETEGSLEQKKSKALNKISKLIEDITNYAEKA